MPKNKGKGGKGWKRGKKHPEIQEKNLNIKEDLEEYAKVIKLLGNCRLTANCYDDKERLCIIPGKLRKRVWINQGDIILISLRSYQDSKADVIHVYSADEARRLMKIGEIPFDEYMNESEIKETEDIFVNEDDVNKL